ncbi:MAG: pantoate--beta-alanine ligase [Thermodesulfobacteriota bacterium]
MRIVRSIPNLKALRREIQGSLGFVPTMGYLHEGHLSLVRRAKAENDYGIVSIFVNPTQFLPNEDFRTYPRDEGKDLALLEKEGIDLVFLPEVKDMYPDNSCTFVTVEGLSNVLEGAFRPSHFRGVATVVTKLFNLVEPTRAYFGQKDAQQVLVIKKMVADLDMNLQVIVCPTIREEDGLAMSSRNVFLNPEERRSALVIYRALFAAQELWLAGERDGETLRHRMRQMIESVPGVQIDYISVADPTSLTELERIKESALASLAVKIGRTRLIDNVILSGL